MILRSLGLSLLIATNMVSASEIDQIFKISPLAVRAEGIHGAELLYRGGMFAVAKDGLGYVVDPQDVDSEIRDLTLDGLEKFAGMGKFKIVQFDNGQFAVRAAGGLNGGGAAMAHILYWVTKSLCWVGVGTAAAIVGTGVAAATLGAGGNIAPLVGSMASTAAGTGVEPIAAMAGAGINHFVPEQTAVEITQAGVVAGAGLGAGTTFATLSGTAAAIEGVSMAAWTVGMVFPWF